jgi:hypothetical protein
LFKVLDWDGPKPKDNELVGQAQTTIGQIMGTKGQLWTAELEGPKGKKAGTILIKADSI